MVDSDYLLRELKNHIKILKTISKHIKDGETSWKSTEPKTVEIIL